MKNAEKPTQVLIKKIFEFTQSCIVQLSKLLSKMDLPFSSLLIILPINFKNEISIGIYFLGDRNEGFVLILGHQNEAFLFPF